MGSVVQDYRDIPNAEAYTFHSVSAFTIFLYVRESMGRSSSINVDMIKDLPSNDGLEQSQQNFIWVLRDADKENVFLDDFTKKIELPKGFEERVKERGIVVRDWAPQLEILAHNSTGGFLSHCGWNSCMESISMGVPLAAWPMHSDQPRNTVLITKILEVGLVAKDWTQRDELVTFDRIEKAVRILMASKEGEEMRKRAKELSLGVKNAVEENGVTKNEFDAFIAHITRAI
ncbi:hypothetical protein KY290_017614 [Solanum tuberosum]|uniref:Uncharacterized protein n=1 Tax=Solanum tuberosum TaxID=4113 RepID=A0ABQ7VDN4_SOLTU|nr:hypothetical protein KY290_017614 [Solanum tuberosum]